MDELVYHYNRLFKTLNTLDYSQYYSQVFELLENKSIKIRSIAVKEVAQFGNTGLTKAKELIEGKNKAARHSAAQILVTLGTAEALSLLESKVDQESDDDTRDVMLRALCDPNVAISKKDALRRVSVAKLRGKLDKPIKKWLDESLLPQPYFVDGSPVDEDTLRYIFYRQNRSSSIELEREAAGVIQLIDSQKSIEFVQALYDLVEKNGGLYAKNKIVLAVIGYLADQDTMDSLLSVVIDRNSEAALKMITVQKSDNAIRALHQVTRVFSTKYPNLYGIAHDAISENAEHRGVSYFTLLDELIPDFGFEHRKRAFDVEDKIYQAVIGTDLKIVFVTPEGKTVKSLPKSASQDCKNALKDLKVEISSYAKIQRASLENHMITARRWSSSEWKYFFINNALMHAMARSLVWGLFLDEDLQGTFRLNEDLTCETLDGEKISLLEPEKGSDFVSLLGMYQPKSYSMRKPQKQLKIGLLHPLEIEQEELLRWQEKIDELDQVISQLKRKISLVPENLEKRTLSSELSEKEVYCSTFKSRSNRLGWIRGSVVDAGYISSFFKRFDHFKIEAIVETRNLNVQDMYADGEDVNIEKFYFVPANSVYRGSYIYDEPNNKDDERLIPFGELPPIAYSEIINDLEKILKKTEQ